ncbi:MAG: hypothetical protein AAGA33_09210 [Pseudomonadota bacterium]
MNDAEFGILACGTYVPRHRLPGQLVADAHAWFQPSLKSVSGLSRSFANWDEDALTMAVEAGRRCLSESGDSVDHLAIASTTLPFADRSNAGIIREALDLGSHIDLSENGGSQRAASSTLSMALRTAGDTRTLLLASDCYDSQPAAADEASTGHAAAGVVLGPGEPIATLKASVTLNQDFVDHYRSAGDAFNYSLEPRWTRDAGYKNQVVAAWSQCLVDADLDRVDRLLVAAPGGLASALAKSLSQENAGAALSRSIGYAGSAQALLVLADALGHANAGETVALLAVGQGIDLMIFDVKRSAPLTPSGEPLIEDNYTRYLATRRLLAIDEGIRAERDNRTSQSAAWRKHEAVTAFKGGKCSQCGTVQYPMSRICVDCGASDSQVLVPLSSRHGKVRSFTEDWLAFTQRPPLVFGNVGFGDGANVMMEFTDVLPGQLEVDTPVELRFRIKDLDERRGFRRYFWKPTPASESRG